MKKKENSLIYIIILNWNGLNNTVNCLNSLLKVKSNKYKILIIDNGSIKDEASILAKKFGRKIDVIRINNNLGFTGGCNLGIKKAQKYNPDYYLLLNNDTVVDTDFLKYLILRANSNKRIGIISPIIYDYNKEHILFSGGNLNWLLARPTHNTNKIENEYYAKFITGCSLLIKKELIEKIGTLDDRFFAYFEDAAFCELARKSGYSLVCEPKAVIYHNESSSAGKKSKLYTYLFSRNRILFAKHYGPSLLKIYFPFFFTLKLLLVLTFFTFKKENDRAYAFLKGYIDGIRDKGGPPRL